MGLLASKSNNVSAWSPLNCVSITQEVSFALAASKQVTASVSCQDINVQAQGSPKVKRALPAATATYCFPSIAKLIGDAKTEAPH